MNLTSILEELPGIGPVKRRALLKTLGSLRAVRQASVETLSTVPGLSARDVRAIRGFFDALDAPLPEDASLEEEGARAQHSPAASDLRPARETHAGGRSASEAAPERRDATE